jgi:tetratricopeptide (TPR) repeat protein
LLLAYLFCASAKAQEPSDIGAEGNPGHNRILLVLPFDNLTGPSSVDTSPAVKPAMPTSGEAAASSPTTSPTSSLDWLGEAAPEILGRRFTSAGFLPLTREDRLYALDHLGLPETFQPSRATSLRIAETLDASYIVIGNFRAQGSTLTLKARILDVAKLRLSEEVVESGEISRLIPLLDSLAWQLTRKLDPSFSVAEETFVAAGASLRLDAFEQYIRGITEHNFDEQLRHLKKATELSPDFTEAWLATGRIQFANQQFEQAAISFAKVSRTLAANDPAELEAGFYRGLALLYSGNYPRAEESFATVARMLPLPEVVNNEAVALARRGRDGIALFRQAQAGDPNDADYHFNLAVSLRRHGDNAEAMTQLNQALKLRPTDSEADALRSAWDDADPAEAAAVDQPGASKQKPAAEVRSVEPLERIKRSYDGAAFRQAALMLNQVEEARLSTLSQAEQAAQLSRSAQDKLDRGLLLEAERGYQAALAADDHSAQAHAGLAQVRERAGDMETARKEARAALVRQANLDAYLVLARLDLAANHLIEARDEAAEALKLDSSNRAARDLRRTIETRIETPAPKQ